MKNVKDTLCKIFSVSATIALVILALYPVGDQEPAGCSLEHGVKKYEAKAPDFGQIDLKNTFLPNAC
jgi:hypothetical protein